MTPQEILVKNGFVADISSPKAIDHFLQACNRANLPAINAYIELGIDVNAYDSNQANALTKATEGNHTSVIELLVKAGANLEDKDGDGDTPLQTSINWGNVAATRKLVELGANPNCESKYNWTPLTRAIKDYREDVVKLLLEIGADVNYQSSEGYPPIWYAYNYNNSYISLLVQKGAEIDVKIGTNENTLLMLAVSNGNETLSTQLLNLKADTSLTNKWGWNAYMIALEKGVTSSQFMTKLVAQGISQQQKALASFFVAARNGETDELRLLLAQSPQLLNALSYEGKTALAVAATNNRKEAALFLLEQGAATHAEAEGQWDALTIAVHHQYYELAKIFLDKGFPVNDNGGNCLGLVQAITHNNHEIFQLLLEKGGNIETDCGYGQTLLYEAVYKNHLDFVETLLQMGADPDVPNKGGYYPIYQAVYYKYMAVLKKLLQMGANPNAKNEWGETPLYVCANQYHCTEEIYAKMAELLLEYGADYSLTNRWHTSPYEQAKSSNNAYVKEVIERFVLAGKSKVAGKPDEEHKQYNTETLKILIELGEWDKVKTLVEQGISIIETREEVKSPLHFAVEMGNEEMVKLFLEKGADVNYLSSYKCAVLSNACYNGNENIVKMLVEAGANINHTDYWNESALCSACSKGNMLIAKYLIEKGATLEPAEYSFTPLMRAAQANHLSLIEYLIELGANVNAVTENGYTAIGLAAENNYETVVYELLRAGANPNIANYNLETPLTYACKKANVDLIRSLISAGADVHFQNKDGQTAISIIRSRKELKKEFKELLKAEDKGAGTKEKPIFKPQDLREPDLFYAVYNHDLVRVRSLLNEGIDVNLQNYRKDTPLMMAVLAGNEQMIQLLLQKGASTEAKNMYNDTAWAYCMVSHNENIEKLLKKYGAKVDVNQQADLYMRVEAFRTAINQTDLLNIEYQLLQGKVPINKTDSYSSPLGLAISKDDKEMVALLLKLGANPSVTTSINYSPLINAVSSGCKESIIKLLIKAGANLDFIGTYGSHIFDNCMYGQHKYLPLLVESGIKTKYYNAYSKKYYALLHELKDEQAGIVAKLAKVMDINEVNDLGENALFAHLCNNQLKVATAFLKVGANPNHISSNDETPLTFATHLGEIEWIKLFLKYGGEPHFKPNGALSAYEVATDLENKEVLALFDKK